MRLHVPSLKTGKRDGYRLIYRKVDSEEAIYILLLDAYFKGDKADLADDEYARLMSEADDLLDRLLEVDWEP